MIAFNKKIFCYFLVAAVLILCIAGRINQAKAEETASVKENVSEPARTGENSESKAGENSLSGLSEITFGEGYTVLKTTVSEVEGYTWEDLYTVLILVMPSNCTDPEFSLFKWPVSGSPMIILSGKDINDGLQKSFLYLCEGEKLYLLGLQADGECALGYQNGCELRNIKYCPSENALYSGGNLYYYKNYSLIKRPASVDQVLLTGITETEITDAYAFSSENIGEYVQELTDEK